MHVIPFTHEDQDAALAEGWGLFSVDVAAGNVLEVQRFDAADVFTDDDAARAFVKREANAGSDLHRRAFALIGSPAETASHLVFTIADQNAAIAEGWVLIESGGYYAIQRDDESGVFNADEDAVVFVSWRARNGSTRHRRAKALHGQRVQDWLTDVEMPTDTMAFSAADRDVAFAEGWMINVFRGHYIVQRSVNAGVFERDADALRFVKHRAAQGSDLHTRAVGLHSRPAPSGAKVASLTSLLEPPLTAAEQTGAASEGWQLVISQDRYNIVQAPGSGFASDLRACLFVHARADEGSALHQKARDALIRTPFTDMPLEVAGDYDESVGGVHITSRNTGPIAVHAIVKGDPAMAKRYARLMAEAPRLRHALKGLRHVAMPDADGNDEEFELATRLVDEVLAETEG